MGSIRRFVQRLISIGDEPSDDDDLRLRKRVGVLAGIATIFAPLTLPIQTQGQPASYVLAVGLATFSVGNLVVLAATRRFDRYLIGLIAAGTVFVPAAHVVGGGITGTSPGLVWAFLVPAYAIMALGPRRAVPWFGAFLISVLVMVVLDPWARDTFGEGPYPLRVFGWAMNVVLPLSIVFVLLRFTDLRRRAAEARADELLVNAIPSAIATRLKHGEERIAEHYPDTTVLFADVAGFTPWANRTDAVRVVALLEDLFTRFDRVAIESGIEKLKTMGDAYMAVAGAPLRIDDHAAVALRAAQGMLVAAASWREAHREELELRIGVASGPVVGGVIGRQRIVFDLWGDTVNTAARMQTSGVPGRIQVAASTMRLTTALFNFEERQVDVKGLGPLTVYLLQDTPKAESRSDDLDK
jgi:adenylate cyclase